MMDHPLLRAYARADSISLLECLALRWFPREEKRPASGNTTHHFKLRQVIERPLLFGGVALDGINDDLGVHGGQHSWPLHRGRTTRNVQFSISLGVFVQALIVFGAQVCCRPPRGAAGTLFGCYLPDHVCQSALRPGGGDCTDRHPHGAGRLSRLVCQL
jgi:hypothetical protein